MIKESSEEARGLSRRSFLECMAWLGTGAVWTMNSGILRSEPLSTMLAGKSKHHRGDFTFVQISDTHIGFSKDANKDVISTLRSSLTMINALPIQPDLLLHTGDLTHLSTPDQFDILAQELSILKVKDHFFTPGEHDVAANNKEFLHRYGKKTKGDGWQSFDHRGVHFIGLVNVMNLKAGGMGTLGHEQLEWLEKDLKQLSSSTPIVVFAHIPLWSVYPDWGWGTDDSAQALTYLKRFGAVTILNGHIHQVMQKVEGNITFHTAMSTAFPQPKPGTAKSPGPMKVADDVLRSLLGTTTISRMSSDTMIAIVDRPIVSSSGEVLRSDDNHAAISADHQVTIDNFKFTPEVIEVLAGATIRFLNKDDIPHQVVATDKQFSSPLLDTDQSFDVTLQTKGIIKYYCSLHPKMTGEIHII